MKTIDQVKLEQLMATRLGSITPSEFPDEEFDLYSIPAFDRGKPEITRGNEIGSAKQIIAPGDVLLSKIVPHIRRSWIVGKYRGKRIIASGEWIVFRGDSFHPDYLKYVLTSNTFHSRFMETVAGVGGSLLRARPSQVAEITIPLPPLPEQRRIAAILDKADAIRRKREEGIRLTEELLRSTFLEIFGDPATNPKGWHVETLGDVITFVGGSQPPKETFIGEEREGYIRLVQIRDFKTDKYKTFIPKELARRQFDSDDVMIARYGPPVFQILRGLSGSYNVALMKAQPTEKTTKDFIFYLLQTPFIHDTVVENSSRTAGQTGVNLDLLNNLKIPIPPITVQHEIGVTMRRIERVKAIREQGSKDSETLFGSLVQRAFRGEL